MIRAYRITIYNSSMVERESSFNRQRTLNCDCRICIRARACLISTSCFMLKQDLGAGDLFPPSCLRSCVQNGPANTAGSQSRHHFIPPLHFSHTQSRQTLFPANNLSSTRSNPSSPHTSALTNMGPAQSIFGMRNTLINRHAWTIPYSVGKCRDRSRRRSRRLGSRDERVRGMAAVGRPGECLLA